MSYRFTKRLEVQFRDCDPLGHVNNAVYITYLEVVRFAYCKDALGFTPELAMGPLSFIMARVECNFRSQARQGRRRLMAACGRPFSLIRVRRWSS